MQKGRKSTSASDKEVAIAVMIGTAINVDVKLSSQAKGKKVRDTSTGDEIAYIVFIVQQKTCSRGNLSGCRCDS